MKTFKLTFRAASVAVLSGVAVFGSPTVAFGQSLADLAEQEKLQFGVEESARAFPEILTDVLSETQTEALTYSSVKPILDARCVTCHQPGGRASFLPLTTLAEIKPARVAMYRAIANKSMPQGNPQFAGTAQGRAVLMWILNGTDLR